MVLLTIELLCLFDSYCLIAELNCYGLVRLDCLGYLVYFIRRGCVVFGDFYSGRRGDYGQFTNFSINTKFAIQVVYDDASLLSTILSYFNSQILWHMLPNPTPSKIKPRHNLTPFTNHRPPNNPNIPFSQTTRHHNLRMFPTNTAMTNRNTIKITLKLFNIPADEYFIMMTIDVLGFFVEDESVFEFGWLVFFYL